MNNRSFLPPKLVELKIIGLAGMYVKRFCWVGNGETVSFLNGLRQIGCLRRLLTLLLSISKKKTQWLQIKELMSRAGDVIS